MSAELDAVSATETPDTKFTHEIAPGVIVTSPITYYEVPAHVRLIPHDMCEQLHTEDISASEAPAPSASDSDPEKVPR
jgi:hypothetical protein